MSVRRCARCRHEYPNALGFVGTLCRHCYRATKPKPYHMAAKMDGEGNVSPLCAVKPRALDLSKELWTVRPEAVTCKRCRAILAARPALAGTPGQAPAQDPGNPEHAASIQLSPEGRGVPLVRPGELKPPCASRELARAGSDPGGEG